MSNVTTFFVDKGKGGLANLGATCYLNTAVQCLSYCTDFLHFVLSSRYKKDAESHGKEIRPDALVDELRMILVELWLNKNHIAPKRFLNAVRKNIDMNIFQQNDINEFISMFLSKLHSDICYNMNMTKKDLVHNNKYTTSQFDIQRFKMDVSWMEGVGKEYSEMVDLFYGQSIMQIICGKCNHISHNYEIHTSMMVPITEKTETLDHCIREYMMDEYLNDGAIAWTCDECKSRSKSKKSTKLWRNPKIMIISLKRFTEDLRKNQKYIEIPEELDISQYTITKQRCRYRLTSVAMHHGNHHGGHYVAFCHHPDGKWYQIDDLNVSACKDTRGMPREVGDGYVFFYTSIC